LKAKINECLQHYDQALQDISRAISLNDKNANYYEIRAQIAYKVEEYKRCIQDANTAIKLNPHSAAAYLVLSQAYMATDDRQQASRIRLKPGNLPKNIKKINFEIAVAYHFYKFICCDF